MQRVFIGIRVDNHALQCINKLVASMGNAGPKMRWVPENNRHLTLAFLGDKPACEVEMLARQFDETYLKVTRFEYRLSQLARFPGADGRIVALTGATSGALENLFQLTGKLLRGNKIDFEQKKFRPHITLARIRNPNSLKLTIDQPVNIRLDVSRVTLYQSTLTGSGSVYSVLQETRLHL